MQDKIKKQRMFYYIGFLVVILVLIIGRLGYIMLFQELPESSPVARPDVERGPIFDRNGRILAIHSNFKSVSAWTPYIEDVDKTASLLADALSLDKRELQKLLLEKSGYTYIKRKISDTETESIKKMQADNLLKGINLEDEMGRSYPQAEIASHVVGYVNLDNIGLNGIEREYEKLLNPRKAENGSPKAFGNQIFLTLDINLQYLVQQIAQGAKDENMADSVIIIVLDAKNAETLALCSLPNFNPNNFTAYTESERTNRAINYNYEPGSVFKIFSISSFLDLGGISPESEFFCNGSYTGVNPPINDIGVHHLVHPKEIIQFSCNVGAALASESVASIDFYDMLRKYGFGQTTQIGLPGERSGILRTVDKWSGRSKPAIAFGQEVSVSAMQMVKAATALTNSGTMLKPLIVKKILTPAGDLVQEFGRTQVQQVLGSNTAWEVLEMMKSATTSQGTARRAAIEGIDISAKTGTAEVYDPKIRDYSEEKYVSSFIGIFPTNNPSYIVYVVIENPKKEKYYGSQIAAPVFKEIAEEIIRLYHVPKTTEKIIEHSGEIYLPQVPEVKLENVMPDLIGQPKRKILSLFGQSDMNIEIRGQGYVKAQHPEAGTELTPGTTIILELE
ncbi:MAG: transpeptidase family protein [Spirochaetales bacterium]|nr:transpeptidase family protein [Spirochaetales bacterium]